MGFTRPNYNNLNTSKFQIDDPLTEINTGQDINTDIGFIFNRGSNGTNAAFLWDESAQRFVLGRTSATGDDAGNIPILSLSNLEVGIISGGNLVASGLTYPTTDGTNGQVITTNGNGILTFQDIIHPNPTWGTILGVLSNQTDLQDELDAKLNKTNDIVEGGTY